MPHQLSPQKPLLQIYDEVGGEVLLLGEPGCGKTTLLLELAHNLLERAREDESSPIPVVFNLSSWAIKCLPLREWLVEELYSKYQVSPRLGREWVANNQILPLFDGLDEVIMEQRGVCIQTINAAHHEGLVPVVCCRRTDYDAVVSQSQESLTLQCALVIQPLTRQQIDGYLTNGGDQLLEVSKALQNDPELQEMITTPLMLSILSLAYAGRSLDDLMAVHSPQMIREQIFATYVERMLHRRKAQPLYPPEKTTHYLSWLAQQLMQKSQAIFHLERMQPTWLANDGQRFLYNVLVRGSLVLLVSLASFLIFELYSGLLYKLLLGVLTKGLFTGGLGLGLQYVQDDFSKEGLASALKFALLSGLIYGLMSSVETRITPAEMITWSWRNIWQNLSGSRAWGIGLLFGLLGALLSYYTQSSLLGEETIRVGLVGLLFGLLGGLLFAILSNLMIVLLGQVQREHPLESPNYGDRCVVCNRLALGLIFGLVMALIFGMIVGLLSLLISELNALAIGSVYWLQDLLLLGLQNGLVSGMLLGGITGLIIGITSRGVTGLRPVRTFVWLWMNVWQELRKSAALAKMLIIGLIFGLFSWLSGENGLQLFEALWSGVINGLLAGLMFGLFSVLIGGLSSKTVEDQTLVRPNQGIKRSIRNSILVGLVFGLLGWLVFGLTKSIAYGPYYGWWPLGVELFLSYGITSGLLITLFIGLSNGGLAGIQQDILLLILRCNKLIPYRYICFLDYAAERVLLRKVGGGYIFIHRLLLEHFATLTPMMPAASAQVSISGLSSCEYYDDHPEALLCPQCGHPRTQTPTESIQRQPSGTGKLQENRWQKWTCHFYLADLIRIGLVIGVLILSWLVWDNARHFYPLPHWSIALDEPLHMSRNSVWSEDIRPKSRCVFTNGIYQISVWQQKQDQYCMAKNKDFSNFAFETQMTIVKGGDCMTLGVKQGCGGLIFRVDPQSRSFYEFWIEGRKGSASLPYYGLDIYRNGKFTKRLATAPNIAISQDPQQWNLLAVVAQGNSFELYVNHRHLITVSDPETSLHQGQIGLIVNEYETPTEILYCHVRVWTPSP